MGFIFDSIKKSCIMRFGCGILSRNHTAYCRRKERFSKSSWRRSDDHFGRTSSIYFPYVINSIIERNSLWVSLVRNRYLTARKRIQHLTYSGCRGKQYRVRIAAIFILCTRRSFWIRREWHSSRWTGRTERRRHCRAHNAVRSYGFFSNRKWLPNNMTAPVYSKNLFRSRGRSGW